MAARFSAAEDTPVHPPPSHEWELLSMSTISSSTLLSGNHGLGFGLPPLSTPHMRSHTSSTEKGDSRKEAERGFAFGHGDDGRSLPLDVSQIAVLCSSTSSVEPFTEGWKPQFRIAGADLQENYYAPDPFAKSAASKTGSSVEPFPNMEHSFMKEPSIAAGKGSPKSDGNFFASKDTSRAGNPCEYAYLSGDYDPMPLACEELKQQGTQLASEVCDAARKTVSKKGLDVQGKCSQQNGHSKLNGRSYLAWSVALTTTLFGVWLISYCLHRDHRDLPTRDEGKGMARKKLF